MEKINISSVKIDANGNIISNSYSTYKYDDKGWCISKDDEKYTYTFDANRQWKTRKGSDGSKAERTVTYW